MEDDLAYDSSDVVSPPACKWGQEKLHYYKISSSCSQMTEFFGNEEIRVARWRYPEYADFIKYERPEEMDAKSAAQDMVLELLRLLKEIYICDPSMPLSVRNYKYSDQAHITDETLKGMLQLLGVDRQGFTVVRTHAHLLLDEQGKFCKIDIDVTIRDQAFTVYFLAITNFERYDTQATPLGQLIAGAIAAFQHNNSIRLEAGNPLIETMIFPAIIFTTSLPTFYHIKITKELVDCVQTGKRPSTVTPVVELCLPIEKGWMSYGIWNLRNRGIVMQVIENMKDFLPTNLNDIPSGWQRFLSQQELGHFPETLGESTGSDK